MSTETIVASERQLERERQADEQLLDDRLPRPERVAEVEAEHAPEPRPELHAQRLIQAEPLAHGRELLGIDVAGLRRRRRSAGPRRPG